MFYLCFTLINYISFKQIKHMASIKAVLHEKKDQTGKKIYRLAIRVTVNRKVSYLYLGHTIKLNEWNDKKGIVKTSHNKHAQLNRLIRKKFDQIDDLILEYESARKTYTAKQITSFIKNKNSDKTFFILAEEYLQNLEKSGKIKRAKSDKSRLNRIDRKSVVFGKIVYID